MGPPPRQPNHDRAKKSLTLPPLQHGSAHSSPAVGDTHAKSLEAMILSIPIVNKIKTLARISGPLTAGTPHSPSVPTIAATASNALTIATRGQVKRRGLVIAIDAADTTALKQLTRTLAYALSEYDVEVIATPRPDSRSVPSFQSYLRLVDDYHTLSAKIKGHIAIPVSAKAATKILSPHDPSRRHQKNRRLDHEDDNPLSPKSFPHHSPPAATPPLDEDDEEVAHSNHPHRSKHEDDDSSDSHTDNSGTPDTLKFPIAILPAWQLTHTDAFACSVDISDRYSPIDHWQWGATVWRGVIGADITIAVRADVGDDSPIKSDSGKSGAGERERTGTAGSAGAGAGGGPKTGSVGSQGSIAHPSGVEVKLEEARAVIVKGEAEGGVAEGSLRRVGFEVGEWVRSWADREMGRRGV